MILRLCAVLMLMLTWSCSGDEKAAEEPVKPAEEAKIPDSPGDAAAAQPAEAPPAETAAEPPAEVEKSTSPGEVKEVGTPAAGGDMTVTAGALNVRSGAGMKNGVVRVLKKGEKVATQGCAKGWCKLGEGEYASAKYLQ